jgi:uncharacterized membrane protein YfcA
LFDLTIPADLFGNDFVIASLAVLAASLIRGFSGFGSVLITAPMLSLVWGPTVGVPVAALIEVVPAIQMTPHAIRTAHWPTAWAMGLPAVVLLPVGSLVLLNAPAEEMRRVIAAIVLLLAIVMWIGWRYRGPRGLVPSGVVGALGGALAGATGMGGPPVILYLMSGDNDAASVRANMVAYFSIILVGVVINFGFLGLITTEVIWRIALMVPIYVVGVVIGTKMFGLASERTFKNIALATLAVSSTWVLFA